MGTTEQVVKNYLRKVYDKLGVADRLELALYCLNHHVVDNTKVPPLPVSPVNGNAANAAAAGASCFWSIVFQCVLRARFGASCGRRFSRKTLSTESGNSSAVFRIRQFVFLFC